MTKLRAWLRITALVLTLIYYLFGLILKTKIFGRKRERGLSYRRKYIRVSLRILGVELEKHGQQADFPALYVSNHRSLLDPLINLLYIDAVIVSKAEVSKYPLIGIGAKLTGVIFVQRQEGSSRAAAKEAIRKALLNGLPVLIYPEGTTSNVPATQEFKLGSFAVAAAENIPVVPVAVEYRNPDHKWNEGGLLPFFVRKFSAPKIEAFTAIGDPFVSNDPQVVMKKSRAWIDDQVTKVNQKWKG